MITIELFNPLYHWMLTFIFTDRYENNPSKFDDEDSVGKSCLSGDGQHHEDGNSWHDGCRLCYCYGGQEMCALISCPRPSCSTPVFRQGDCCPSCPGKEYHHNTFSSGQGHYLSRLSELIHLVIFLYRNLSMKNTVLVYNDARFTWRLF